MRAIEVIEARTAENSRLLENRPAWFAPDVDLTRVPVDMQPEAERLRRIHEEIRGDRLALVELRRELLELEIHPNNINLCYRLALNWLNNAQRPEDLIEPFTPDPVNRVEPPPRVPPVPRVGRPPRIGLPPRVAPPRRERFPRRRELSEELARAILRFRDAQPNRRLRQIEDLTAIPGVDELLIRDLIYTGCQLRLRPFRPTIGVLTPLRLETRFYPPAGAGQSWKMRVRIVPNNASLNHHDPIPTDAELDNLERMWQQAKGDLTTQEGKDAWRAFVAAHTGPRAAWLARTFRPTPPDANGVIRIQRPAQTRTQPRLSRFQGVPKTIELWLGRGGAPPTQVATLNVDLNALQLDMPNLGDPNENRWWHSYKAAEAVGLAIEIDLGPGDPNDSDVLYAVGLGGEAPDTLFQAHRDAGALALLELGTPTNTIDGEPAADLGGDPEYWRLVVLKPPSGEAGTEQLSLAMTGMPDALGPLPGGSINHREVNQWLVQALWPALWGHIFKDILGLGPQVADVGLWAGQHLIPEGPLPASKPCGRTSQFGQNMRAAACATGKRCWKQTRPH